MKQEIPLKPEYAELKERRDKELADIMTGKDDRFLLIIGPCSADNETAVLDYCERLAKAADEVKDKLFIVPRVYTNKPRTIGKGYKGMLHQPDPEGKENMMEGIKAIRRMHVRVIEIQDLPVLRKSSIRKITDISPIYWHMEPSGRALSRISFTG